MKALTLGEALIDIVEDDVLVSEHVGGSPLNVAVGLARLGVDSTLATWFGTDSRGDKIAALLEAAGVTVVPGSDQADKTSVAFAKFDQWRKAVYTFDLLPDIAAVPAPQEFDHLHVGSIAATLEPSGSKIVDVLERATGTISYDPNIRPDLMVSPRQVVDRIEQIVSLSDVVKASNDDIAWLYPNHPVEDIMSSWIERGVSLVVITQGPEGALAMLSDRQVVAVSAHRVAVADTICAGDSFMAGLLSGLEDAGLLGAAESATSLAEATFPQVEPALARAVHAAAITIGHVGAYAPTKAELD